MAERIFTRAPVGISAAQARLAVAGLSLVIAMACLLERGSTGGALLLFGVPCAVAGVLVGRWWLAWVPVAVLTISVAVGAPCSATDDPQAAALAAVLIGTSIRRLTDRLPYRG